MENKESKLKHLVDEGLLDVQDGRVIGLDDAHNRLLKDSSMQEKALIIGNNLSICFFQKSMAYDVWQNSLDEDNRKYVPDEVFETLEEAQEVIKELIASYSSKDGPFVYAVIRNKDRANLGYVQLVKIQEGWEIGYHIAKIFTGKGYATEAVNLFLNYLKDKTDIKQIYGIALKTNKASKRVLEKTGFKTIYEGPGIYQGKRRQIIKTIKELK